MEDFLSNTVLGLSTAAIFALAASGLVLTYTTTGIFNFAHGAIAMLGAFSYWQLHVDWGWPIPLALARCCSCWRRASAMLIERGIMRGLVDAPETIRIIVTVSLLVALLGVGQWIWPPTEVYRVPLLFRGRARRHLRREHHLPRPAPRSSSRSAVAIGLRLLLYRTQVGLDMRASVDSRPLAMLHGARPHRSAATAWAIGCWPGGRGGGAGRAAQRPALAHEPHAADRQRLRRRHDRPAAQPSDDVRGGRVPRAGRLLRHRVPPRGQRVPHHVPLRDPGRSCCSSCCSCCRTRSCGPASTTTSREDIPRPVAAHGRGHRRRDRRRRPRARQHPQRRRRAPGVSRSSGSRSSPCRSCR